MGFEDERINDLSQSEHDAELAYQEIRDNAYPGASYRAMQALAAMRQRKVVE